MGIPDKYYRMLGLLIQDKRDGMNGYLSDLCVMRVIDGYVIYYRAYMNREHSSRMVFVEDIEKGNVVFLLPFGVNYLVEEMEQMAKENDAAIRNFFGDKFKEDMVVRISEEERQKEIRRWSELTRGAENWDTFFDNNAET